MSLIERELRRSQRARRAHSKQIETKAERKRRLVKAKAERLRLRRRLVENDDAVWSFAEWCAVNGISARTGRRILASGSGPIVTRLSDKRIGISIRNNRLWQQAREAPDDPPR